GGVWYSSRKFVPVIPGKTMTGGMYAIESSPSLIISCGIGYSTCWQLNKRPDTSQTVPLRTCLWHLSASIDSNSMAFW
ncbi:MAG TPA: hypothetical protein VI753_03305, partial [Anaerolineales bacterium]|nr:hypothetical protein [Anaerolineales bacterium]